MASKNRSTSVFAQIVHYILGFPKSMYVNFRCLPFAQAIHFPILVSHKTKLKYLSGDISVHGKLKIGLVKIGLGTSQLVDFQRERTIIDFRGKVVFNGKCKIGSGSRIAVANTGTLIFNHNFSNSSHLHIICFKYIEFGEDNHVSWNTLFMDTDQHAVYNTEHERINEDAPIKLGNRIWYGCNSTILKGTELTDDLIIGASAVVCGRHLTPNVILAGQPAKIVKEGVSIQ